MDKDPKKKSKVTDRDLLAYTALGYEFPFTSKQLRRDTGVSSESVDIWLNKKIAEGDLSRVQNNGYYYIWIND